MAEDDPSGRDYTNSPKDNNSDSDNDEPLKLDLGLGPSSRTYSRINERDDGAAGPSTSDTSRREENPFSFKHFLRSDGAAYQNQGARPKVYCDGRPISSISDLDLHQVTGLKQTRIVPEFSSGLPDFVQDHLVIEQCYLEQDEREKNFDLDMDNLPDFAPYRSNGECNRSRRSDNENLTIPLDLPVRLPAAGSGFPLDLPLGEQNPGSRSCPTSEGGASKSLPDFLTDGAVRSQNNENGILNQSPESETDALRRELELSRRQLVEHTRRCAQLQIELEAARNREQEYTQNLAKALEQVEESIDRSNQRSSAADHVISKLKQEVRSLKNKVGLLQRENEALRREDGASGGPSTSTSSELHSHRLAEELRSTATSAEHSLRQLLLGVNNLRLVASAIENLNRIEEKPDSYSDTEDSAGPAL